VSDAHDHQRRDRRKYRIAGIPNQPVSALVAAGHVDDLVAGYALGALEPDEAAAVDAHVRGCVACESALAQAQRTANMLPFTIPLAVPPTDAKVALFARIAHAQMAAVASALPAPGLDAYRTPSLPASHARELVAAPASVATTERRETRRSWLVSIVSLPLLVALIATGFWGVQLRNQLTAQETMLADLQSELANFGSGATSYPLSPGTAAPQAEGQIVMGADQRGGILQIDVNSNDAPRAYELWVIQDDKLVRAAEVTVNQDGQGQARFELDQPFGDYESIHVRAKALDGASGPIQDDTLVRNSEGLLGSTGSSLDIIP
jgi:anti-sigma factor RsiW